MLVMRLPSTTTSAGPDAGVPFPSAIVALRMTSRVARLPCTGAAPFCASAGSAKRIASANTKGVTEKEATTKDTKKFLNGKTKNNPLKFFVFFVFLVVVSSSSASPVKKKRPGRLARAFSPSAISVSSGRV